jgi:hypothetical protein
MRHVEISIDIAHGIICLQIVFQGYPSLQLRHQIWVLQDKGAEQHTCIPSGKFIEESIKTASWLKFISNLQRLGAI